MQGNWQRSSMAIESWIFHLHIRYSNLINTEEIWAKKAQIIFL